MAALFLKQAEIGQRVAVHHQEVGDRPRRHGAELSLPPEQRGVDRGRLPQHLHRRQDLAPDQELPALAVVERPEQVRPEAHAHAGGATDFEGAQARLAQALELVGEQLGQAELDAGFAHGEDRDQGRHDERAGGGRGLRRVGVDQGAMLDRAHAERGAAAHRARRVGVGHHVGAARRRLLHGGADLVVGILVHPDRIGRRQHAAGDHQLDLVGALAQLLPRRAAHFVRPVGDGRDRPPVAGAAARLEPRRAPHVAVPAALAQRAAREQDARAGDQPLLHGAREARVGAARVAHRREAPVQRRLQVAPRVLVEERGRHVVEGGHVEGGEQGVEMGVDQAGHQRPPARVDSRRVRRRRERPVGDLHDPPALHRHRRALAQRGRFAVEHRAVLEQDHRPLPRSRSRTALFSGAHRPRA